MFLASDRECGGPPSDAPQGSFTGQLLSRFCRTAWLERGRQPRWLAALVQKGKEPSELLIK
ncbi:H-NS family nucleoid-associated regulatory protein [Stenotrophomonas maltophilia]|uniref:H-NS family nucleoid-associated regulatory protein n=1 Tax=Stenotrophomonas maltophilia TaxID=40324 RepID=UPI003F6E2B79